MISGAMGTVRASTKRSEGPKGRRLNRPCGVSGHSEKAILRCSVMTHPQNGYYSWQDIF